MFHIFLEPWRENTLLYKNVVVAHISYTVILISCNTLSLVVADDQITSVCMKTWMQAVVMVVYGSKID